MIQEAVILAGGLGTRLRQAVPDLPKAMAPVNGKPFIHYQIKFLLEQGVEKLYMSLGYEARVIQQYCEDNFPKHFFHFIIEEEPLGTGGAIKKALQQCKSEDVLIVNGDSVFMINLTLFYQIHQNKSSQFSLALKKMQFFDRYGTVEIDEAQNIKTFKEKSFQEEGLINSGVYLFNREAFLKLPFPEKFSVEKDFFEKYIHQIPIKGMPFGGYFIDIGIPEDFEKAQKEFKEMF